MQEGGNKRQHLIQIEQGVPGGGEEASPGGYEASGHQWRGCGSPEGERSTEAAGGRTISEEPGAKKSLNGVESGWGDI